MKTKHTVRLYLFYTPWLELRLHKNCINYIVFDFLASRVNTFKLLGGLSMEVLVDKTNYTRQFSQNYRSPKIEPELLKCTTHGICQDEIDANIKINH